MMRKITLLLTLLMLGSLWASAQQSSSKVDLFGGYSYFNGSTSGLAGRYSLNGWNGQGTYNVTHWLGATADFGGYYGSPFTLSANDYSFLFGLNRKPAYRAFHAVCSCVVWRGSHS